MFDIPTMLPYWSWTQNVINLTSGLVQIAGNEPQRAMLWVANSGSNPAYFFIDPPPIGTAPQWIVGANSFDKLTYERDGVAPTYAWLGKASLGTTQIVVTEFFWRPTRES